MGGRRLVGIVAEVGGTGMSSILFRDSPGSLGLVRCSWYWEDRGTARPRFCAC